MILQSGIGAPQKVYTIKKRNHDRKVTVVDQFNRTKVLIAGSEYVVGDIVLVVSGIIVSKVSSSVVHTFEV